MQQQNGKTNPLYSLRISLRKHIKGGLMKFFISRLFFFSALLLTFCDDNKNKEFSKEKDPPLQYEQAFQIVQNKYLIAPDSVFIGALNKNYIAAIINEEDYHHKLVVVNMFAGTWQEIIKIEDLESIEEVEFVVLDDREFLYYCVGFSGSSAGSVSFILLSIESNEEYSLTFSGPHGHYDEMSIEPDELKNNKQIFTFLENKASLSDQVYKPSKFDLDMSLPINYYKQWELLNPYIRNKLENEKNEYVELKMPEYDADLFSIVSNTEEAKIENKKFIIISYFKKDVIAYNKTIKKYFVVWIPETDYSWVSKLEFLTEYEIFMTARDDSYKVDLKNKKIMMLN
jgi:hypothetical protein